MSQQLVANELLAFLQQKLDVMDEVSAVQICSTNFSEEDIATAKLLLYKTLNKADQMVSRRRDGTKKSVQDIITLLKETDPDDVPTFVAKDLHKLPPVTFDHVDVTSLLKDIVFLKASLVDVQKKLDASQNTVADLRNDLIELRKKVAVTGSPSSASKINMRRGANLDLSGASFASAVLSSPTPSHAEPAERAPCAPRNSAPAPAAPPLTAARPTRPSDPVPVSTASARSRVLASVAVSTVDATTKPLLEKAPKRADGDGFVTVQRRKRRQRTPKNRCGTAPVEPNVIIRAAKPNTPVYISRLHYSSKAEDIVEYVRQRTKYTPRVQLLESRRNVNFRAFVVRVPTCLLHLVMEEDFWPQGVVFRRFRGQVPHDRTVNDIVHK